MHTGGDPSHYNKFYDFGDYAVSGLNVTPAPYDNFNEAIYGSDEFRMFAYKIKQCTRTRSHDWTECPYAHRGEKATRRDPQKVSYVAIACPEFRNGKCHKGDACEFAHGVFEYWLHPARYRTRACNAGRFCQRKVCFFAHTPDQLRPVNKYACPFVYKSRMNGGDGEPANRYGGDEGSSTGSPSLLGSPLRMGSKSCYEVSELLITSLRNLKIRVDSDDDHPDQVPEEGKINGGIEEPEDVLPHLDWISELVE